MDRDQEWIIAMATALGTSSGMRVPIVPDVRPFRELFDALMAKEREAWQQAAALMLVARSGQVTDMKLAERLTRIIAEDREKRAL
jgi:hypothetical protein